MPRIRSIKPEFWADFPTARLSRDARLLYIALWNFADEHGRMAGDPRFIKGQVFPYDDDLSADAVEALVQEIADTGKATRYVADGAPYLHLPKLRVHQRLEPNKVPSRLPEPPPPGGPGGPGGGRADESARRADSSGSASQGVPGGQSESRAHSSARGSDAQAVDNFAGTPGSAFPQVTVGTERGADLSARDADSSTLLYVAGSREQVAGGRLQGAENAAAAAPDEHDQNPGQLPDQIAILRSKMNTRRLVVRWDRLTPAMADEIVNLIDLHGDEQLVKVALQAFQPNNPPVFAQAWIENWRAMPAPGEHLRQVTEPACTQPGHTGTTRHCAQCASEALAARPSEPVAGVDYDPDGDFGPVRCCPKHPEEPSQRDCVGCRTTPKQIGEWSAAMNAHRAAQAAAEAAGTTAPAAGQPHPAARVRHELRDRRRRA